MNAYDITSAPFPGSEVSNWSDGAANADTLFDRLLSGTSQLISRERRRIGEAWSGAAADAVVNRLAWIEDSAGQVRTGYSALKKALEDYADAVSSGEKLYGPASAEGEAHQAFLDAQRVVRDAQDALNAARNRVVADKIGGTAYQDGVSAAQDALRKAEEAEQTARDRLVAAHDARLAANQDAAAAIRNSLPAWEFDKASMILNAGGFAANGWRNMLDDIADHNGGVDMVAAYIDVYGNDPVAMAALLRQLSPQGVADVMSRQAAGLQSDGMSQEDVLDTMQQWALALGVGLSEMPVDEQIAFGRSLVDFSQYPVDPIVTKYPDIVTFLLQSPSIPNAVFLAAAEFMDEHPDQFPPPYLTLYSLPSPFQQATGWGPVDIADAIFSGLARDVSLAFSFFQKDGQVDVEKVTTWFQEYDWGYGNAGGITEILAALGSGPIAELLHDNNLMTDDAPELADGPSWEDLQLLITLGITGLGANAHFFADAATPEIQVNMAESLTYLWDAIIEANGTNPPPYPADTVGYPGASENGEYTGPFGNLMRFMTIMLYNPAYDPDAGATFNGPDPGGPGAGDLTEGQRIVNYNLALAVQRAISEAAATDGALALRILDDAAETLGQVWGAMDYSMSETRGNQTQDAIDAWRTATGLLADVGGMFKYGAIPSIVGENIINEFIDGFQERWEAGNRKESRDTLDIATDATSAWLDALATATLGNNPAARITGIPGLDSEDSLGSFITTLEGFGAGFSQTDDSDAESNKYGIFPLGSDSPKDRLGMGDFDLFSPRH